MTVDWRVRVARLAQSAQELGLAGDMEGAQRELSTAFDLIEAEGAEKDVCTAAVLLVAADLASYIEETEAAASLYRRAHDICLALDNLGGVAHRSDLLKEIKRIRVGPHPESIEMIVQRTIQNHSSSSAGFRGRDLLYTVKGIGSGVWGLRSKLSKTKIASDIGEPDQPERVQTEIYRILRDTELARKLKQLHQHRCQLCGLSIALPGNQAYAEAHHIKPLGSPHNGPDVPGNIIVLCPNHHAELDFGAQRLAESEICTLHGHVIEVQYIEYHNTVIYGKARSAA